MMKLVGGIQGSSSASSKLLKGRDDALRNWDEYIQSLTSFCASLAEK